MIRPLIPFDTKSPWYTGMNPRSGIAKPTCVGWRESCSPLLAKNERPGEGPGVRLLPHVRNERVTLGGEYLFMCDKRILELFSVSES